MHRLCYISTTRQPIDDAMCEDILAVSRRNNQRDEITGLLVAGRHRFLQVLEGEEAAVLRAFARIKGDPRHFACVLIADERITERQFPTWAMGFERSNERPGAVSDAQVAAAMIGQITDANLRAQFEGFLDMHWRDDRAA